MRQHKFIAGQSVRSSGTTSPSLYGRNIVLMAAGAYDIVRTLPMLAGHLQYRVRSLSDGHERVAVEDDLCLHLDAPPADHVPSASRRTKRQA